MRAIRKNIALTQHEMAQRLGVTRKTIMGWEASEDDLDEGVALNVRKVAGAIRLIEYNFWVDPTINDTYAVVGRRIIGMGGRIDGQTILYGEFKRRDHAYRWCAALRAAKVDAHGTRKLRRERAADQAERDAA